jgi:hypothetical protein
MDAGEYSPPLQHEAKPVLDQGAHGPPGSARMKSGALEESVLDLRGGPIT